MMSWKRSYVIISRIHGGVHGIVRGQAIASSKDEPMDETMVLSMALSVDDAMDDTLDGPMVDATALFMNDSIAMFSVTAVDSSLLQLTRL